MVRANAATLLFDTFPLVNADDGSGEGRDTFLQKQFTVIEDILLDSYPQVRTIGQYFWHVWPTFKKYIKVI